MGRAQSREAVFKLVFEYCVNKEKDEELFNEILADAKDEVQYITTLYNGVVEKYDELCDEIAKNIKNFSFDRIFKVDLAILLVALFEIKYMENVPATVSINEAVKLSKVYSTEKSYSYINGVLSNFVKDKNV